MIIAIFEIILFCFFLISAFYLPGKFFISKFKLDLKSPEDLFFPFGFGLLIFTAISYIASWFKADLLIVLVLLILDYFAIKEGNWKLNKFDKRHIRPLYLVLFLSIIFSLSMLVTGKFGDRLVYAWRDDFWHLALINELKVNFPPDNPGIAGIPLKGYHFFYNFILAKASNIFFISPMSLHFRFFPLFMAMMWGLGVYNLMFSWTKKISASLWAVFLTMFGGSFAFLLQLQGHPGFSWNYGLGMQQGASTLYNPPLGISIIIILTALFALFRYFSTRKTTWLIPFVLSVGLVAMFKVYAGIILVGAAIFIAGFELLRKKVDLLIALFPSAILFFVTYWVFAGEAGYLIFHPLWAPHSLLTNFSWYGFEEKMYTYTKQGVTRKILEVELYGLAIYIFGNLGTRMIGILLLLIMFFKNRKTPSSFALFVLTACLISILAPLFFLQSGKVFEIVQMTQYFLFFSSLFAAIGFAALFSLRFNKLLKAIVFSFIILITLPSAYETLNSYKSTYQSAVILSSPYFQSMKFLERQGDYNQTVLQMPPLESLSSEQKIEAWYRKASNPAIVAFANKRAYFNYEFIDFPGIDIKPRVSFLRKLFVFSKMSPKDSSFKQYKVEIEKEFMKNEIEFIYATDEHTFFTKLNNVQQIYKNGSYMIYKVNK